VFLAIMVAGLVGLVMMALPALGGHHLPPGHGHGLAGSHTGHLGAATHAHATDGAPAGSTPGVTQALLASAPATHVGRRFLPSPRTVFSVLALYGAFGNALVHAAHFSPGIAALLASGPALLVEWILIRPVWNLMFRFQAEASSPLEALILAEAQAVVPFRNGRGVITTIRDGRRIQLQAQLRAEDAARPVAVGERLRIEDVDPQRERVTVSVPPHDEQIDKTT
jgi:hypothetical protein